MLLYWIFLVCVINRNCEVSSKKIDVKKCCASADRYHSGSKRCVANQKNIVFNSINFENINLKFGQCDGKTILNKPINIHKEYANLIVGNETSTFNHDFCVDADSETGQNVAIICKNDKIIRKCCPIGEKIKSDSIFTCQPDKNLTVLEDIVDHVKSRPNLKVINSASKLFYYGELLQNFAQLNEFNCVDKFYYQWIVFNVFKRPLSPWIEILSIIFIIVFVFFVWVKYINSNLLDIFRIFIRDYRKNEEPDESNKNKYDIVSVVATTSHANHPVNEIVPSIKSKYSDKKTVPIKLLIIYSILIFITHFLSICLEIFQNSKIVYYKDTFLLSSCCVLTSVWYEVCFRRRAKEKSETYYFASILLATLLSVSIFHKQINYSEQGN